MGIAIEKLDTFQFPGGWFLGFPNGGGYASPGQRKGNKIWVSLRNFNAKCKI